MSGLRIVTVVIVSASAVACRGESRGVPLAARGSTTVAATAPGKSADTATQQAAIAPPPCLPEGTQVVLDGPLAREVHLGPPGYGETPARDRRDTITVVMLKHDLVLCADPDARSDTAAVHARRIQLMGKGPSVNAHWGFDATVYGRVGAAVFGFQFTPVIVYVDSVIAPGPKSAGGRA